MSGIRCVKAQQPWTSIVSARITKILLCATFLLAFRSTLAAEIEEVVVTGSLREERDIPGAFVRRRGDSLLLQITVRNDAREQALRKREIYQTLHNAVAAANRLTGVELSLVDAQSNVIALDQSNYEVEVEESGDETTASLRIKKKIPTNAANPEQIVAELVRFVHQVAVVGRTTLEADESVEISIIDPNRYRADVIQRFGEDVNRIRTALGPDYRLLVMNIDRPVKFVRVGPLEVALYIPYSFVVVPATMNSFQFKPD